MEEDEYSKLDRELFLKNLAEGKIILADMEKYEKGNIKYYYIQKIC